jgi:hypothetical protein
MKRPAALAALILSAPAAPQQRLAANPVDDGDGDEAGGD